MQGLVPVIFPSVHDVIVLFQSQHPGIYLPDITLENCKNFNKYSICGPNNLQKLMVPVNENGKETKLNDLTINYSVKWIREHKNALQTAYGKSPFYEFYDYRFFKLFDQSFERLIDLNMAVLDLLCSEFRLGIYPSKLPIHNEANPIDTVIIPVYPQVFSDRHGFQPNVSCLDLLFNLGPLSRDYFESTL